MEKRVITVSTQTMAIKAQRLLAESRIKAKIIKLHPSQTPRGCTHGVQIDERDTDKALSVLDAALIVYTGVIRP